MMDPTLFPPPTIPQAQGNPSMASLLQMIQQREAERPSMQQQKADLQAYIEAVRNSQPLNDDAWASAGRGILSSPVDNMFGAAGQEIVKRNELVRQDKRTRDITAAKLKYDDTTDARKNMAGLGTGATTAMVQAVLDPIKNIPGIGGIEKQSGRIVLPSSLQSQYDSRWKENFKLAQERKADDPNTWATEQTNSEFSKVTSNPAIMGGRVQGAMPAGVAGQAPVAQNDEKTMLDRISKLNQDAKKYRDNPEILKSIEQQMTQAAGDLIEYRKTRRSPVTAIDVQPEGGEATLVTPAVPKAPAPLLRPDPAQEALRNKAGEGLGKSLADEYEGLRNASAASSQLKMSLNTLKELYTTENMPEGAQGEMLQGIRSSLKTVGIDLGPEVAAGDMVTAIAGKMALLTRTAEGGNLMPGAMSDFEQKILRGLVPGLNQTAQGRAALIEFLNDMADVRIRLASEANKLADKTGKIPTQEWYSRRDRVLKEEQARLAVKARELAARFKQGEQ